MRRLLAAAVLLAGLTVPALAGDDVAPSSYAHITNTGGAGGSGFVPVGSTGTRVSSTPTVTNNAYSSGNCLGGFNAVTIAAANGQGILLNSVDVKSIGGSTPTVTVYVFDSNPSASTCTDRSTFTLNSADVDKLVAPPFGLTLVAPTGATTTFATQGNMGRMFLAGGSASSGVKTLYYALVSGSSFTPGSTSDIHLTFQAELLN